MTLLGTKKKSPTVQQFTNKKYSGNRIVLTLLYLLNFNTFVSLELLIFKSENLKLSYDIIVTNVVVFCIERKTNNLSFTTINIGTILNKVLNKQYIL